MSLTTDPPLVFVDTNVLIYAEDLADAPKHARALQWLELLWQRRQGRVSTQVLNEFYTNVTRKIRPPMPMGDARAEVRRYQRWNPWQIDQQTVETAWAFEARFALSYWDALVLAAASHQGCRIVLTEDLQHGQTIDSLRIVNPFLQGPELLDELAA
jgi:predicted nucleic acid-binding protein